MRRLLFYLLFSSIVVVNTSSLQIVDRHLRNEDCRSGVTHRLWSEAWEQRKEREPDCVRGGPLEFIVLHYTVCPDLVKTYAAYNRAGVSANFTLENDGTIYLSVDPDLYIAFHAGQSAFAGRRNLNYHSIGIEHVNPGFVDDYRKIPGFGAPAQIFGDPRWWFPFAREQFESSVALTAFLQRKYRISGWNVVTHADIAIGRKSDIGPMWDYRRAHNEFGAGFWYDESHQIDLDRFNTLVDTDYIEIIRTFGYTSDDTEQLIRAYQMHYVPSEITGTLTTTTKEIVLKHAIGLKGLVSPITGERFEYFESTFQRWSDINPDKLAAFSEYF